MSQKRLADLEQRILAISDEDEAIRLILSEMRRDVPYGGLHVGAGIRSWLGCRSCTAIRSSA